MRPHWWAEAERGADKVLEEFTSKLRDKLKEPPRKIIRRKNPFLFRIRVSSVAALSSMVIEAYLSSSEETMFGSALQGVAQSVSLYAKNGRKSGIHGIDLEYDRGDKRTIMQIKSGQNWGNSSQHSALRNAFKNATIVLRQGGDSLNVRCVEGICYGKSGIKDLGTHLRIVGHSFWEDISDWEGTAHGVLAIVGKHASNGLHDIREEACRTMSVFLRESGAVRPDDKVNWPNLLDLVMK